jgi:hypothetical protein
LIATVFLRMVFFVFLWFSQKLSFFILFFNIELIKNYSYNMWGKHCNFPRKLLWIAIIFFSYGSFLFCYVFSQNYLYQFYFSNIKLVNNCNYKFFLTKHYGLIQFFLTWFFSSFFCVFFFCNIFFLKLSSSILFFLILRWLEFNFCVFFLILSWL